MRRLGPLAALLVLAACSAAPPVTPTAAAPGSPSVDGIGGIAYEVLDDATPALRDDASIEAAFDAASAATLLEEAPAIDFARRAVVCLYLGERTGKWGFAVNALTLENGTLHIASSERPSRAGDTSTTHPAECLAVDRAALPGGELPVTAVDTVSDEFIVDGTITVPPGSSGP